jgi:glutamyl-tRNA reductase
MNMPGQVKIITITHKHTNLKHIGEYVIKAADNAVLKERLEALKLRFDLPELLYLATCNRVMYLMVTPQTLDDTFVSAFFQEVNNELPADVLAHLPEVAQVLEGQKAVEHLYEVAASMDSLVVGERQILGQLRDAYDQCKAWGLTGDGIRLLIQHTVVAAKAVYAQTRIGDKPVSVASLAIQQLLKSGLPTDARILMIGAGQTNMLVAKFLLKHHFHHVTVFNRSVDKAQVIADMLGGHALPFHALSSYTEGFDCIIVCTGAAEPIITESLYASLLQGETDPKIVIDLAIPHNVMPGVSSAFPMHYIEIEGLRHLAHDNLAFRKRELHKARILLSEHISAFPALWRQRQMELAMQSIPAEIKAVKDKALNEVFRKEIETLDSSARELMERMLAYMEKKCIGIPMKAVREGVR